jgi:hypothetical protein
MNALYYLERKKYYTEMRKTERDPRMIQLIDRQIETFNNYLIVHDRTEEGSI